MFKKSKKTKSEVPDSEITDSESKKTEKQKDELEGRFYTFPNKFRMRGYIMLGGTFIISQIIKYFFSSWRLAHYEIYVTACIAISLLSVSFIVMAKRQKQDDYRKNLLDRTNWFILRFIVFYSILSYILVNVEHLPLGYDAFLIIILATYFVYYQVIKLDYEKLGKAGKSKD